MSREILISTSAGEKINFERNGFVMVEFGEQLRSAREIKGLTQKALADQLYVTRQTVSRWECGERYPDIITLKKLSQVLSVSLDDLLSGKEMTKVAEKNPVVENKTINNITSVLYAFVVIMLFMGIVGEVALYFVSAYTRFGFDFYLPRFIRSIESIVLFVIFAYGLYNQILDKLTPKIIGIILTSYFAVYVLLNGIVDIFGGNYQITDFISGEESKAVLMSFLMNVALYILCISIIPGILGGLASYSFFIRGKNSKKWELMIIISAALRILDTIITFIKRFKVEKFYTANSSTATLGEAVGNVNEIIAGFMLGIAFTALIIYQTYTLYRKRRMAMDLSNEEQLVEATVQ